MKNFSVVPVFESDFSRETALPYVLVVTIQFYYISLLNIKFLRSEIFSINKHVGVFGHGTRNQAWHVMKLLDLASVQVDVPYQVYIKKVFYFVLLLNG